jgi:hypothetical protein
MDQLGDNQIMSEELKKEHGLLGNQNAAKPKKERLEETRTFRFKASELAAMKRAAREMKVNGKSVPLRVWVRLACCQKAGHAPPEMEPETW